jgi:Xaa-Pro aminopeptidase
MDERTREPLKICAEDINPRYNWACALPSLGTMGVDFEERVNYRRLHRYRLGRAQLALHERPIISRVVSLEHPTEIKEGHGVRDRNLLPGDRRLFRRPWSRTRAAR